MIFTGKLALVAFARIAQRILNVAHPLDDTVATDVAVPEDMHARLQVLEFALSRAAQPATLGSPLNLSRSVCGEEVPSGEGNGRMR